MAGMKRFVTYIYSYEDRKKGSNTGFAKIEIRGIEGRMEIHLRGIYPGRMTCKVYLFAEDAGDMVGILLGEMGIQNGTGDFAVAFKVDNLGGMAVNFFSMEGIVLIGEEQRIFMSRWKEGKPLEVCVERFHAWNVLPSDREEKVKPILADRPQEEQKLGAIPSDIVEKKQQTDVEQTDMVQSPADSEEKELQGRIAEAEEENVAATEIPMRNVFPRYDWREIWENLKANHENFVLCKDREISCIKIELKDIRELPRRYWYLGNNSFLLHGFFNYRYLVVGRIEEGRWFMGVPGIYQNQERVMAIIFGFPEFLPNEVENQFGYWYRVLEE